MKTISFKLYLLLTVFIGSSLASFLGISLPADSFLSSIHYRAIPLLVLSYLLSLPVGLSSREKLMVLLCLSMLIIAGIFNRSAYFAVLVNNGIEPVILIALLRKVCPSKAFIFKTFLIFFLLECFVAWIEVITRSIIFADLSNMNQDTLQYMLDSEMRAYSLHGHPLQNAFLVSILSFFFLTAKGTVFFRYGYFFMGYITLFAFNTRSSIYLMGVVFALVLFHDFKSGVLSKRQKSWVLFFVGLAIALLSYMVVKYQFGSRLFELSLSSKDDSSNTRYMLLGIVGNLQIKELLFGLNNGLELITTKYALFAIENSLVNFIITNGLIFTLCWCLLIYFCLKPICRNVKKFNLSFLVFFGLINANNALMTEAPFIIFYVLALYALDKFN